VKPQLWLAPDGVVDITMGGVVVGHIRLQEYSVEINFDDVASCQLWVADGITALFRCAADGAHPDGRDTRRLSDADPS
jgi:hypothetical protein